MNSAPSSIYVCEWLQTENSTTPVLFNWFCWRACMLISQLIEAKFGWRRDIGEVRLINSILFIAGSSTICFVCITCSNLHTTNYTLYCPFLDVYIYIYIYGTTKIVLERNIYGYGMQLSRQWEFNNEIGINQVSFL